MTNHQPRDIAFLERLNKQLVEELDKSLALEKKLREIISKMVSMYEFELETANLNHREMSKHIAELGESLKPFAIMPFFEIDRDKTIIADISVGDIITARKALGYDI
jgi:hypothetical protein